MALGKLIGNTVVAILLCAVAAKAVVDVGADNEVLAEFNLTDRQKKLHSTCSSEFSRVKLRAGGNMVHFCACVVKDATEDLNEGHKHRAIEYFRAVVKQSRRPNNVDHYFPEASYRGHVGNAEQAARSVFKAADACADGANEAKANKRQASAR